MNEPVKTNANPAGQGAPEISNEQYQLWLDDMRDFLKQGATLWYAMEKTQLLAHKDSIYKKYRLKDWFSEKVDAYRATPGELINYIGVKIVENIKRKIVEGDGKVQLTPEEVKIWRTMAERHRSAQPFFVNRTETADAKEEDLGKILDILNSDYGEFNQEGDPAPADAKAAEQKVENDTSLQDQEQGRPADNVQTE